MGGGGVFAVNYINQWKMGDKTGSTIRIKLS